jgi:hypothetical protein
MSRFILRHRSVLRYTPYALPRIMHETRWRDRGDGRATGQPSRSTAGLGPEACFFGTSQGARPEDAREDGHIRARSRWFVHSAGSDSRALSRLRWASLCRLLWRLFTKSSPACLLIEETIRMWRRRSARKAFWLCAARTVETEGWRTQDILLHSSSPRRLFARLCLALDRGLLGLS